MKYKTIAIALVLGSLVFPAMAQTVPTEDTSLEIGETTPKTPSQGAGKAAAPDAAKSAEINGGLNRDIIRRKALRPEEKSGSDKDYAPRPQKGIEPDEIDRK